MIKFRSFAIVISAQARKDIEKLPPKLKKKLKDILENVIVLNPYEGKKLIGDLAGSYSYQLSLKDRIVYGVDEDKRIVYIERAKTHYGD